AGNIPLVGFHDVMCVLLSGHKAKLKFSSDDNKLFPLLLQVLVKLEPQFAGYMDTTDGKLEGFDAVLATGSNNTSRYFEHYFGHVPHIIRRNRHSAAVLTGSESDEELKALGHDIFDYFGLGCRSVSKLYLPNGYDFNTFFGAIFDFGDIVNHHKYANNYDYNKAVWLLNKEDLLDNGFVLLRKSTDMTSPTGSLHYEFYDSLDQVRTDLQARSEEIQCVVGEGFVPFGKSQSPRLNDYADGVDTMVWLAQLSRN
ncbi:MAG: acyl-CoA reductase, partial [Flavobacteriales bacterium]|nr:acyl-CoA reductase [Flavobacteriales bacterium]